MRQRVISALVGLLILAVVLIFMETLLFNFVMMAVSCIALYEMLQATGSLKHKGMCVLAFALAILFPFAQETGIRAWLPQIVFLMMMLFFIILMRTHSVLRFEQAAMIFVCALYIPLFFSSAVYLRNIYGVRLGGLYLLWALGSAWLSDTGAYFSGLLFGKHKLAPVISPKKTVEGAVGGVITATVFMLLIGLGYSAVSAHIFNAPVSVNYLALALITPVISVIGVLGDLSASVIKRQFKVKDFGNIMPGHGGVMDRFDSVLFTLPTVFMIVQQIEIARIV